MYTNFIIRMLIFFLYFCIHLFYLIYFWLISYLYLKSYEKFWVCQNYLIHASIYLLHLLSLACMFFCPRCRGWGIKFYPGCLYVCSAHSKGGFRSLTNYCIQEIIGKLMSWKPIIKYQYIYDDFYHIIKVYSFKKNASMF